LQNYLQSECLLEDRHNKVFADVKQTVY